MDRTPGVAKRAPRIDIRKPATVINSDGAAVKAIILDVSGSGFRLEVSENLRIGEFVTLRVDRDDVPAQIRWILGNEAGGAFLAPVDHRTLGEGSGSSTMANDEPGDGTERRDEGDRRKGAQRQHSDRRQADRGGDRRTADRREKERRK
jgi:hypothetical protein